MPARPHLPPPCSTTAVGAAAAKKSCEDTLAKALSDSDKKLKQAAKELQATKKAADAAAKAASAAAKAADAAAKASLKACKDKLSPLCTGQLTTCQGNLKIALAKVKDLDAAKALLASTATQLASTKKQLASTKTELASTKTQLASAKNELASSKTELSDANEQLTSIQDELGSTAEELAAAKEGADTCASEKADLTSQLETSQATVTDLEAANVEVASGLSDCKLRLNAEKTAHSTCKSNLADSAGALTAANTAIDDCNAARIEVQDSLDSCTAEKAGTDADLVTCTADKETAEGGLAICSINLTSAESSLDSCTTDTADCNTVLGETTDALTACQVTCGEALGGTNGVTRSGVKPSPCLPSVSTHPPAAAGEHFALGNSRSKQQIMGNCASGGAPDSVKTAAGEDHRSGRSAQPSELPDVGHKMRPGNVRDVYKVGKTIGTGGFSVVKAATDKATGQQWACKIMSLPPPGKQFNENESSRADIFKEIDILIALKHDNIVLMKEYFEEGNKVYLFMEMLEGGELLDAVLEKGHYSEGDARSVFLQIIKAIQYLHSREIVHRDLKLENLLLVRKGDISHIKIADFGLARRYIGPSALTTICGTPQYVAPEIIKGGPTHYGPECDLWSAGVILFILLGGYPPFYDESEPKLKGRFDFNDDVWTAVSEDAKDMIRKLLAVDPQQRMTISQVLEHPWCKAKSSGKGELLKTKTRMQYSKAQLLPSVSPPEINQPTKNMSALMEDAKSGAALDAEEQKLLEELAAEHAAEMSN
ncbi:Calcium/calmodulin-dependent protein kinase type 1D [Chlorella vulgaris]